MLRQVIYTKRKLVFNIFISIRNKRNKLEKLISAYDILKKIITEKNLLRSINFISCLRLKGIVHEMLFFLTGANSLYLNNILLVQILNRIEVKTSLTLLMRHTKTDKKTKLRNQ